MKRVLNPYRILALATALTCALATGASPLAAAPVHQARLDAQLQHMLSFRAGKLPLNAPYAPKSARAERVKVYLVFATPPDATPNEGIDARTQRDLERLGVSFVRHPEGTVAHVGPVYGVEIPWRILPQLQKHPQILQIDAVERRLRVPSLDLSMPEIDWSDLRWMPQAGTDGLTGRGVLIADFDTSMDITHPALLKPDAGFYDWLDVDQDGRFMPEIDAVDLNSDGLAQGSEILGLLEGYLFSRSFGPQVDGFLDADTDWLYADVNANNTRDAGLDAGFGETDPAYGEPLFLVEDADLNGDLDPGEKLVRLGTSKILKAMDGQNGSVIHERGKSLLTMSPDPYPHGTSVAGILAGDVPGRRYAGVAPEAELLSIQYDAPGIDLVSAMSWAKTQGADVFLYEFGEWIGEFLDGTSALEQAVTSMSASGIPQVCPAGNIGQENKHGRVQVPANGGKVEPLAYTDPTLPPPNVVYLTALWRQQNPVLSFQIAFPGTDGAPNIGAPVTVTVGQTTTNGQGDYITAVTSKSSKNTNMLDLVLTRKENNQTARMRSGQYQVSITNTGTSTATLHLFLGDDLYGWSGGCVWEGQGQSSIADPTYSVSTPGTSDGCITVGSYATRTQATVGQLSTFSGRGPRIDETALLDVAAPGNFDVYSPTSTDATYINQEVNGFVNYAPGGYWQFGGTSAASAHVAGVAALVMQLDPTASHSEVEGFIRTGALADSYTGTVPNQSWGMGKLRVGKTLKAADGIKPTFEVVVNPHPVMEGYLMVQVVPSERLSGPPTLTATNAGPVMEVGQDLYMAIVPRPTSGNSLSVSVSGTDLSGNAGTTSSSYTW